MNVSSVDPFGARQSKHFDGCHLVNLLDKNVYNGIFLFSTHSEIRQASSHFSLSSATPGRV